MSVSASTWYAIGLGGFVSVLALLRHASFFLSAYSKLEFIWLRFIVYPPYVFRVVLIILLLSVNVVVLSLHTSLDQVAFRSAVIVCSNLIFLLHSPLYRLATYCNCSLAMQTFIHQSFGWITITHALAHSLIRLASQKFTTLNLQLISGISVRAMFKPEAHQLIAGKVTIASCTVGLLCALFYLGFAYEIFVMSHQLLGPALLAGLWFHIPRGINISTLLLGLASLSWTTSKLLQLWNIIRSSGSTVTVRHINRSGYALQFTAPHPKSMDEGKSILLTVPLIGLLQRHPFLVLPTQNSGVSTIIVSPRHSFTDRLSRVGTGMTAYFDGPFGQTIDFREFGAVVMFASGIGLISHIPYIYAILKDHQNCRNKTRLITVHWIPDSPKEQDLIYPEMTRLLEEDVKEGSSKYGIPSKQTKNNLIKQYLISVFIYGKGQDRVIGYRNRIQYRMGGPEVDEIMTDYLSKPYPVAISGKKNIEVAE